jgi:hypothetical protein
MKVAQYCGRCDGMVQATDKTCPHCGSDLRVRKIEVTDEERLADELAALTGEEKSAVEQASEWMKSFMVRFKLEFVEIGFPSGAKIRLKGQKWDVKK